MPNVLYVYIMCVKLFSANQDEIVQDKYDSCLHDAMTLHIVDGYKCRHSSS